MRVYAEYFECDGIFFRKNTLLKFGDNWNLIGSAVLANPGSAKPMEKVNNLEFHEISSFNSKYKSNPSNKNSWYVFKVDSTMGFLEKIFNGYYLGRETNISGVIQLFNVFNIKNQDSAQAIKQSKNISDDLLFSLGIEQYFHDKPVYFGFSKSIISDDKLRNVAKNIFDKSSRPIKELYKSNFDDNSFYHPMYVNRSYKENNFSKYKNEVLEPLFSRIYNPTTVS